MVARKVIRADDYVQRRHLFEFTVIDADLEPDPITGEPAGMDLAGCTVRSTWRPEAVSPDHAEGDSDADIAATITFDASGAVTESTNLALPPGGSALDGVLRLIADRAATAALPVGTTLHGDVQVTDYNGEVLTVEVVDTITASDAYTTAAP